MRKVFLISLGSFLIGIGVGFIILRNFSIEEIPYWLIVVFSLILGGFFLALPLALGKEKAMMEEETEKETRKEIEEREESK